jgi:protein-S-isoprenylcysteine O-methyltransferase Ste14
VPYVITWCVDNFLNLWASFDLSIWQWDFKAWTIFLIRLCLLIDVCVFAFSYMIESSRLKSDIKSVDPSPLAWFVCLACYPPFNSLFFPYFDVALFSISVEVNNTIGSLFNGVEVLLWMIFAWASITLGFKASNLTARGVVRKGPYRWIRHPAYSAKLAVWWIQCIIFADFSVGILLAFTVIYVMRAWTEERHLLAVDPEYKEYCSQVRWRFLPGVL